MTGENADLPPGFEETIHRMEQSHTGKQLGILASIVPEEKDLDAISQQLLTQNIPVEQLSRGGKQAIFTDVGELEAGPPVEAAQYEVNKILGRGGMGVVCTAKQKSLQREVALKIAIPVGKSSDSAQMGLEQFTNEAYVTAGLDHPNVVPVYTLARDPTGRLFFTMKRVTGVSWEELLTPRLIRNRKEREKVEERSRRMSFEDHLDIWMKVADAVAYAHSKGVIHRDLKPENVMLGSFGEVLLMDWGLAMVYGQRNPYALDSKKKPQLVGTPGYLAPEMAKGKMTRLGPATDVYMLGGILYRLLTGKPPHSAESIAAAVNRAARGDVDPPEKIGGSALIDPEISRIVMRALAKRIEDRYPSVKELQEEIRGYRANAKSLVVAVRALEMLGEARSMVSTGGGDDPGVRRLEKDDAALAYGKLSEAIGSFRQAVALWPENREAVKGLLIAWTLQVKLALDQGDLTLARSHLEVAGELPGGGVSQPPSQFEGEFEKRARKLGKELRRKQRLQDALARRAAVQRWLIAAIIFLVVAGAVGAFLMLNRQKELAQENLRLTDSMHKKMFAKAVSSHAATVEQYLQDVEHLVVQYRAEAARLLALPPEYIPARPRSRSGRDGFYLDEDYYDPRTRPDDVLPSDRYGFPVSLSNTTTKLAPWAREGEARQRALGDVLRLSRLSDLFANVHASRQDIVWSLIGTKTGALVSFPGSGRFREKPGYDPTRRHWFLGAVDAPDDRPRWKNPHVDAGGQGLIISCTSPVRSGGKTLGVIGVELALETVQNMLLDFTRRAGSGARGLLVQPDGRVIVDTNYQAGSTEWKEKFDLITVDGAGREMAEYYRDILAGKADATIGREVRTAGGIKLLGHARLKQPDWVLMVMIDRGAVE
jgi:serine/threonine protein kinase